MKLGSIYRRGAGSAIVATLLIGGLLVLYRISHNSLGQAPPATKSHLLTAGSDSGYVDTSACAGCHRQIWDSYRQTAMGRSWSRIRLDVSADFNKNNTYYHPASDRYYKMYTSGGKYYQRRHQLDRNGKVINVVENEIDYVVGSGNHSLNFVRRTSDGRLLELPVAWYSEKGGYWAMNPGFDNPHHFDFRRQLSYECVFCHTGYPDLEPGGGGGGDEPLFPGRIPEGIDCQRCHGPGRNHIQAAAGGNRDSIRAAIVNPKRLSPQRNLEVCMQCHLEPTSTQLPQAILRFDRTIFSYRPGEALADYALHFDHQPGMGRDDKFEIAHQAYRLRKSACFQKSEGRLTCTTCHNPHVTPHGDEAARQYASVCAGCHVQQLERLVKTGRHTTAPNCAECHMPKRRTDDVVHVVVTDHYIQRNRPARDLLAPLRERAEEESIYKGPVALYYPPQLSNKPEDELYLAVAQVKQSNNLQEGIPKLALALQKWPNSAGEFYFELAKAYVEVGRDEDAIRSYEEAVQRKPKLRLAWLGLGRTLTKTAQFRRAIEVMEKGASMGVEDATVLNDLGLTYLAGGRLADATRVLQRAVTLDPNHSEAHNSLGSALRELGDPASAEQAYRNAIRMQPDFLAAQLNLAKLLVARGDLSQVDYLFPKIIAAEPKSAVARYEYGLALAGAERYDQAREQFEAATRLDSDLAEAQAGLGDMLSLKNRIEEAATHYRRALATKPELGNAHLGLAMVLDAQGRRLDAISHLEAAVRSSDPTTRQAAQEALQSLRGQRPVR